MFRGQVLLSGLCLQAPNPAEQVQFPGRDTNAGGIQFTRVGGSGSRKVGRNPFLFPGGGCGQVREQLRPLNAIECGRLFDVQRGDSKIPIVFQSKCDNLLQTRVGDERFPVQLRSRGSGFRYLVGGCRQHLRNRGRGPGIFGHQRASAHQHEGHEYCDQCVFFHVNSPPWFPVFRFLQAACSDTSSFRISGIPPHRTRE